MVISSTSHGGCTALNPDISCELHGDTAYQIRRLCIVVLVRHWQTDSRSPTSTSLTSHANAAVCLTYRTAAADILRTPQRCGRPMRAMTLHQLTRRAGWIQCYQSCVIAGHVVSGYNARPRRLLQSNQHIYWKLDIRHCRIVMELRTRKREN